MKKVCVDTYGCAANFAEGEMLKGILVKNDFMLACDKDDADLIILNICTVKGNNVAMRAIRQTSQNFPSKKIIIAGCVPNDFVTKIKEIVPSASIINTHNIHKIAEAVGQALQNNAVQILERGKEEKILFPRIRKNPVVGIIPISQGCDSACTFCSVKFIKGNHVSYAAENVVKEMIGCINDCCKEIWLTGQDTSCYGIDTKSSLPELLQKLVLIGGDFKIRLGMANPKHIKDCTQELIEVYKSPRMFKFLHIPVQSGNDEVLQKMKRGYCAEDFKKIVSEFRRAFPDITLSTDIICGFPGETKQQFDDSIELVKELEFDVVNISRFAPRPGTFASKMGHRISSNEKKERSKRMTAVFRQTAVARNKFWKDWCGEVVIDEKGKHNAFIGRNYAYKPIVVNGEFSLGQKVNVKITEVASTYLRGAVI